MSQLLGSTVTPENSKFEVAVIGYSLGTHNITELVYLEFAFDGSNDYKLDGSTLGVSLSSTEIFVLS